MKYDSRIHCRRSIRLKEYDYSRAGWYFITVCTFRGLCLFGNILNGKMNICKAGQMVKKWWFELNNKYPEIELRDFVIMPNHIHGLIEIKSDVHSKSVGAILCDRPDIHVSSDSSDQNNKQQKMQNLYDSTNIDNIERCKHDDQGEHAGSPLHEIIKWFKTMTTNEYIRGVKENLWEPFNKKLWHRNYYEHIIRNEKSYNQIAEYVQNNPLNWQDDKYFV